jgi:hypothetical protein
VFVEIAAPAVVMLEQQFCGSRNVHGAEFTGRQRTGKGRRRQPRSRRRRAHFMRVLRQGACAPVRAIGLSDDAGVEVRLDLKDG